MFYHEAPHGLVTYHNVPRPLATVISSRLASLAELDTVLSVADMWDLLEVIMVDGHNQRVAREHTEGE